MVWWRRDPSLWARTPIHRYAQRTLHDHEAVLRARCFSKSNSKTAQHKDDSRPSGISNLQWMQLQYYRKWKRQLEEDPYNALFGASEDMLSGKGLKNWEWVHKAFPKWMIREMGLGEPEKEKGKQASSQGKQEDNTNAFQNPKTSDGKIYPKKVHIREDSALNKREPMFAEPSVKPAKFERDLWNSGVSSPSDSRRPHEQTVPKSTDDKESGGVTPQGNTALGGQEMEQPASMPKQQICASAKDIYRTGNISYEPRAKNGSTLEIPKDGSATGNEEAQRRVAISGLENNKTSSKQTITREATFIEEFLADTSQPLPSSLNQKGAGVTWRQTSLERLSSPELLDTIPKPRSQTDMPIIDITARNEHPAESDVAKLEETHELPSKQEDNSVPSIPNASQATLGDVEKIDIPEGDSTMRLFHHGAPGTCLESSFLEKGHSAGGWEETASLSRHLRGEQEDQMESAAIASSKDGEIWTNVLSSNEPRAKRKADEEWLIEPDMSTEQVLRKFPSSSAPPSSRKSTTEILDQLPKDDLDFLSASELRASMGRMNEKQEDKHALRQRLEENFESVHKEDCQLHPMVESKILNDQHVRRKERELLESQKKVEAKQGGPTPVEVPAREDEKTKEVHQIRETDSISPQSGSVLETSLDFMSRWLHTGGNVFAQHFWQDPVQVSTEQNQKNGASEDLFFKGILKGIRTGRRAMLQVRENLATDIPASKPLLSQLSVDEHTVLAVGMADGIYNPTAGTTSRDRVRSLQQALVDKDEKYKKACESIDSISNKAEPSEVLKRRLRLGADILQKNAKLTRMMIFGLQTRFEKPGVVGVDQRGRDLLHHVLALHDTQVALSRLVERAMQAYGISAKAEEQAPEKHTSSEATNIDTSSVHQPTPEKESEVKQSLRNAAVVAKLEDEVSAQKAAMQGLSDDGYSRARKPVTRKSLDEPNLLAHSLFRPFGLQLESLGKDLEADETKTATVAKEKADKELVKEVKKAYEDVYGPITVEHRQVASAEEAPVESSKEAVQDEDLPAEVAPKDTEMVKKSAMPPRIQMLKEDEVSPTITTFEDSIIMPSDDSAAPSTTATQPLKEDEVSPTVTTSEIQTANSPNEFTPASNTDEQLVKEVRNSHPDGQPGPEFDCTVMEPKYTIYSYNAQSDEIIITSSTAPSTPSRVKDQPIPLHEALTVLTHPSKYVPHLPVNFEVVAAKPDLMVVRSTAHAGIETIRIPASTTAPTDAEVATEKDESEGWKGINPIDGMASLSPTGYVGDGLDLQRDFEERRRAAGEYHGRSIQQATERSKRWESRNGGKEKRRIGSGGVMKTAIVAVATCYVVGVAAELVR